MKTKLLLQVRACIDARKKLETAEGIELSIIDGLNDAGATLAGLNYYLQLSKKEQEMFFESLKEINDKASNI